jgi:hypothetical protein
LSSRAARIAGRSIISIDVADATGRGDVVALKLRSAFAERRRADEIGQRLWSGHRDRLTFQSDAVFRLMSQSDRADRLDRPDIASASSDRRDG